MRVDARDETGRLYLINLNSDTYLLLAMLLVPAAMKLSGRGQGLLEAAVLQIGSLIVVFVVGAVICEAAGLVQMFLLKSNGYVPVPPEVRRTVDAIFANLAHLLPKPGGLRVVWKPTDFSVDAHVHGSLLVRTLALSGGTVAALGERRQEVHGVIAHEMAHLRNRDVLFYTLIVFLLLPMLFVFGNLSDIFSGSSGLLTLEEKSFAYGALGAVFIQLPLLLSLLRRRELIADAIGMGATEDREKYAKLVATGVLVDKLFHPSTARRVEAATRDNPVLRKSIWLQTWAAFLILLVFGHFLYSWYLNDHFLWHLVAFVLGVYSPLKGFAIEHEKGPARKVAEYSLDAPLRN